MLVLRRRKGEKIEIGEGVFITVVRVHATSVQLGITAPKGVNVRRTELPKEKGASDGKA